MSYNIGRWPITPEELDNALSGLTASTRREREAAAFLRRLAASPLVGKVATRALLPELEKLAPGCRVYFSIGDSPRRFRWLTVHHLQGMRADYEFSIRLAELDNKRIEVQTLKEQEKERTERAGRYAREAAELPSKVAQLNNLLPYLNELEKAAQTVATYRRY